MIDNKFVKQSFLIPSDMVEGVFFIDNKICGGKNNSFLPKRSNIGSRKLQSNYKNKNIK